MQAEYVATHTFWLDGRAQPLVIELALRLTIPGEEGVDVSTGLHFPKLFPEEQQYDFNQYVYDGVNDGIGATEGAIPEGGIQIDVLRLSITPLEEPLDESDIPRCGEGVHRIVLGAVAGLLVNYELHRELRA